MTKKHFEAIAKILKARLETTNNKEVMKNLLYLSDELASYFITTNPQFNYQKFTNACGFTKSQLESML